MSTPRLPTVLALAAALAAAPAAARPSGPVPLPAPQAMPPSAQHGGHPRPQHHAQTDHAQMDHAQTNHAQTNHAQTNHAQTNHAQTNHAQTNHAQTNHAQTNHAQTNHAQTNHASASGDLPADAAPRTPIPPPTAQDLAAAFPTLHAHMHRHGEGLYSYSLIDRLEAVPAEAGAWQWEAQGWVGGDLRRLWWRSRGHVAAGRLEQGELALFAGRAVRPWWDVLAGVRQQRGDGPRRDWLGFGVQGLAPYKFELSATAYLGRAGRHQLRLDGEYDTLLSHRLILQWRAEALLQARADPAWRLGAGLATLEAGLRLRYEIDRQFAPYLGWELERGYGATARLRRAGGQPVREGRWVAGVRLWF